MTNGTETIEQPGVLQSAWRSRGLVAAITVLFGLAAFLFASLRSDQFLAEATIVLEDPGATAVLGTNQGITGDRLVANQLEVVRSGLVATRASELAAAAGYDVSAADILDDTTYTTLRDTDVIIIGFSSDEAGEAETVTNSIVGAYDQVQREQRREANVSVENRLDQADALLREDLAGINEQIDGLRASRALGLKIDLVLNRISALQQQLSETADPIARETILEQLAQEQQQLEILQAASEVEAGRGDLAALLDRRNLLEDRLAEIETQRSSIALQTEIEGSGIAFFSPATAIQIASGAGVLFTTTAGLFVGLLVALGIAYTLSSSRRGFAAWSEPEQLLGVPALAEIPLWESQADSLLPVRDAPRSLAAEAFRFAAANLDVRMENGAHKSVYFASARVGDGKSTLVANIAAAAARTKRVLVVDADFGSQEVTNLLMGDFRAGAGLTELSAGKTTLVAAVSRVNLSSGVELDLLSRGLDPVTAPDFFNSRNLEHTIDEIEEFYDLVLIDGPPLLQVAYASILSRAADATVMVLQHEGSIKLGAELAQRLQFLNASVLGYIYNQSPRLESVDAHGGSMRDVLGDRGLVEPVQRTRNR